MSSASFSASFSASLSWLLLRRLAAIAIQQCLITPCTSFREEGVVVQGRVALLVEQALVEWEAAHLVQKEAAHLVQKEAAHLVQKEAAHLVQKEVAHLVQKEAALLY